MSPALAAGNSVVLKPSEITPLTSLRIAEMMAEVGIPDGVVNVIPGLGSVAGQYIAEHPQIAKIAFTGSTAVGKRVVAASAGNLKKVQLELGGKGANIVFDDADLDNAVHWAVEAIFRNAGQVCLAGSRLFVQSGLYDEFLDRFRIAAEALRYGDPTDPATQFSCLASEEHFRKVAGYVETVEDEGGKILTGGLVGAGSWAVKPTIVVDLPLEASQYCQEIFGPLVVVNKFQTEDEVVGLANDTTYGLNAMLFTENLSRAHRVSSRLRAGTVWVNCFFIRDLRTPFGGVGDSGVGREGGSFSREFFTEPKAVVMQIDRG
jgi:aminomuconate-semialdehyde/2-hydroxymuconate-6-semialdehyde dehydrogenase